MKDRKKQCPICGSSLLVRQDNHVICVNSGCTFKVLAKRKDDTEIPILSILKRDWQ